MSITKLMKRTNENIISGIGENDGVFFFFLAVSSLFFSLSLYLIGKINPNPHIPQIHLIQTQFCWILDSNIYQPIKFQLKRSSYEINMSFLRQYINSASRQVLWRNKSNLLKCKFSTLKRTIFIFLGRIQMDLRDVGIGINFSY